MNRAARAVMDDLPDVVLGFGESDEFRSVASSRLCRVQIEYRKEGRKILRESAI
jgi:hypothetical protein